VVVRVATGIVEFLSRLLGSKDGEPGDLKDPQLRKIGWLLIVGILGVLLLIFSFSPRLSSPSGTSTSPRLATGDGAASVTGGMVPGTGEDEARLERKLAEILSQVAGAGRVNVKVSFNTGRAYDYAENATREESTSRELDSRGVTRETTQVRTSQQMVTTQERGGGLAMPVVRNTAEPHIQGVLVVADGAKDTKVKRALAEAVTTLLDVPLHKVAVLPRQR